MPASGSSNYYPPAYSYVNTTSTVGYGYGTTSITTGNGVVYDYGSASGFGSPPPEPVRRKTELEWLDEEVDKVCALAR